LPPYAVLDGILQEYVEKRRKLMKLVNLGYAPEVVRDLIN